MRVDFNHIKNHHDKFYCKKNKSQEAKGDHLFKKCEKIEFYVIVLIFNLNYTKIGKLYSY